MIHHLRYDSERWRVAVKYGFGEN